MKYIRKFNSLSLFNAFKLTYDYVWPNITLIDESNNRTLDYHPNQSNNVIRYWASSKLPETTSSKNSGLNTTVFNTTISEHTFANGYGEIIFAENVTTIGLSAFKGCTSLTNIMLPNSVTAIYAYAFSGCSSLTNITLSSSITSFDSYTFSGCSSLTEIVIPSSVTSISSFTFYNCTSLSNIVLSNVTSIGESAFESCSSLTEINIPSSVTFINPLAFKSCINLENIIVDQNNITYDSRNNCNAIIETATNKLVVGAKNIIIPNTVTEIGDYAFYGRQNFTEIIIPNSVTSIGNYAFNSCIPLNNIVISSAIESIGQCAFQYTAVYGTQKNITILATTPPTLQNGAFDLRGQGGAYETWTLFVPTASVNTYKENASYQGYTNHIEAITE